MRYGRLSRRGPRGAVTSGLNLQSSSHQESLFRRLRLAMKFAAAHQPTGYIGRLQQRALGRKMGRQIPRYGNKDMPALVAIAPLVKLSHARLEHLVGMKPGILAEQRMPECSDQSLRRVAQDEMASNQACRGSDLLLAVEGIEQSTPDLLRCNGQVVEPIVALTW